VAWKALGVFAGEPAKEVANKARAAFIPFGDITDIQSPLDYETGIHIAAGAGEPEISREGHSSNLHVTQQQLFGFLVIEQFSCAINIKQGSRAKELWDTYPRRAEVGSEAEGPRGQGARKQKLKRQGTQAVSREKANVILTLGSSYKGRLSNTQVAKVIVLTPENFCCLCTHEKGLGFKGSGFHCIIPQFMCHGSDFMNHNGTGGKSICGKKFDNKNFILKHMGPGLLSVANSGPDTNGSQFFLMCDKTDWLDGELVVFGEVTEGLDVSRQIEVEGSKNGKPKQKVI
uniref:Peptidyl-prolyl cis-trans isomerase n=1 Tax=Loxodonta africana TaxID=9785 RepID=G3T1X8_LOXAF